MINKTGYDYFKSFIDFADCAERAAEHLYETIKNYEKININKRMDEIHAIEHEADNVNHDTIAHLIKEFLPPIEREDIVSLCQEFDNMVDAIDDVMRLMCMYKIKKLRPETEKCCELLLRCGKALKNAAVEFKKFKKSKALKQCLVSINSLETEGDGLHFAAVSNLFDSQEDLLNVLDAVAWKNIFDGFEECYDACEDVGQLIENIVLKNS